MTLIRGNAIREDAFLRADGRKGIRNTVAVVYLVECAHHIAREIQLPFRDADVHLIGCEQIMASRAPTPALGQVLLDSVAKAACYYTVLGHGSFAPGNADGGLTTQEEKSMGAYSKSGSAPPAIPPMRDGWARSSGSRIRVLEIERLDRGDVQERADIELGRHAIVGDVHADKDIVAEEHCHLRMTNLIRLATGHHEAKWLERLLAKQFANTFGRHGEPPDVNVQNIYARTYHVNGSRRS